MSFIQSFRNGSFFDILQHYRQTSFAEKLQTRAYTFDDLVGACGGYIGLLLGYSFLQLSWIFEFVFNVVKRKILIKKAQKIKEQTRNKEDI